jgi:hypothetical protein
MWLRYQTNILKTIVHVALHQRQILCVDVLDVNSYTTAMRYVVELSSLGLLTHFFKKCQTVDWKFHRDECNAIREWVSKMPSDSSSFPGDAIRCLVRILWRRRKLGGETVWVRPPSFDRDLCSILDKAREIDGLQSRPWTPFYLGVIL